MLYYTIVEGADSYEHASLLRHIKFQQLKVMTYIYRSVIFVAHSDRHFSLLRSTINYVLKKFFPEPNINGPVVDKGGRDWQWQTL